MFDWLRRRQPGGADGQASEPFRIETARSTATVKLSRGRLVFRLGCNEIIELQAAMGAAHENVGAFLQQLQRREQDLETIRQITYHALKRDQPEITEQLAGDIVAELGPGRIGEAVAQALAWLNS